MPGSNIQNLHQSDPPRLPDSDEHTEGKPGAHRKSMPDPVSARVAR
ncbi:hypothetical protein [Lacisediminimonas profundi]|nr:hypothetical protein [Lacisediminimonas profundi]